MPPIAQTITIGHNAEIALARRAAKQLAEEIGINVLGCEEIALATSELASNLVKHAGGGILVLTPLSLPPRHGLQIESIDNGKGIPNIPKAMTDGYSTANSLGNGLGAINRLMDEFDITSRIGAGTHIVCRKWVRKDESTLNYCPYDIGVATRPKPGFDINGDDFVVKSWVGKTLVGVIDGLGHGELAHQASLAARTFIESHYDLPLDTLFRGVGFSCQKTRGCVMALACFDWERKTIHFASVGNIEARVIGSPKTINFIVRRGIVGVNSPDPHVTVHGWEPDYMLALYSDGLISHWNWQDFPQLIDKPASQVAENLLHHLARPTDDATILIVKKSSR